MKIALIAILLAVQAPAFAARPVLVELFTSQGCSSCPDADKLVSTWGLEAFRRGDALPLSFDVDYWNYLGWKDVFSTPVWSRRQEDYARALGVRTYTPQMVVAGRDAFVGSDREALEAKVTAHLAEPADAALKILPGKSVGTFEVSARALRPWKGRRRVWLAVFENGLRTQVAAGENSGRALRNDFVVRRLVEVGELPGEAGASWRKPVSAAWELAWDPKRSGAAVFLQDEDSLAVTAAASLYPLAR